VIKRFLGAAAVAAIAYAFVPAHAARVGVGCSGDSLGKTEGAVEGMADGPNKFTAEREIAQAQDEMLKGSMRGCAVHLSRASTLTQTPSQGMIGQPSSANAFAQAPAQQAPAQPQWGWQPLQHQ
jgi:hypothetical protein